MFDFKLMELEAELLAREQSEQSFVELPLECTYLLEFIEKQVGVELGDRVPEDWRGWLTYRHGKNSLIVCRGRSFGPGFFGGFKAGLDVFYGYDAVSEYERRFDVSPPADLDYLLVNFGAQHGAKGKVSIFLWYGEGVAAHKLIFSADVSGDPHIELSDAVVEACTWIMKRPKEITLLEFLKEIESKKI